MAWPKCSHSAVIETRKRNPCATLQQIGDKFGVSRERIRQILEPYGFPKGITIRRKVAGHSPICPICGGKKVQNAKFCRSCYHEQHWVTLA